MQLIACQLDIVWENKQANHEKVRTLLADTNVQPPTLIVLPEMFDTGFSMNVDAVAWGCQIPGFLARHPGIGAGLAHNCRIIRSIPGRLILTALGAFSTPATQ